MAKALHEAQIKFIFYCYYCKCSNCFCCCDFDFENVLHFQSFHSNLWKLCFFLCKFFEHFSLDSLLLLLYVVFVYYSNFSFCLLQ